MDCYNLQYVGKKQMSFAIIELDHIKPVQRFALEMSNYKNLQPLFKEINRSKSAKWRDIDETFWRANVQHQHDFTDIYTGTALDVSQHTTQNTQFQQPDEFSKHAMAYCKNKNVESPVSLDAQQYVQTLDKNEAVEAYALEHLHICTGGKTSLWAITEKPASGRKTRAKNGENAFLLRVASVAKRKCDL